VRKRASPRLRQAARTFSGAHGFWLGGLVGLARDSGGREVSALVARIRKEPRATKAAILHCEPGLRDALLRGDAQARSDYLKRQSPRQRPFVKRALDADPRDVAREVASLIDLWDTEIFSEIGPPLADGLEASALSARRLARTRQLSSDRLIMKVTRGIEYIPEPWIDSVVLVPSILNRPWVDITEEGSTKFFIYPASPDAAAPDVELVEVYKALGDETRLRILRLMATGVTGLTDIAEKLGLAKSTVHGHMVILRTAGLTRSLVGVEGKRYALNDRPDLNSLLDSYLKATR
jgi:DNA-binding transcriptional ArsR family regulator